MSRQESASNEGEPRTSRTSTSKHAGFEAAITKLPPSVADNLYATSPDLRALAQLPAALPTSSSAQSHALSRPAPTAAAPTTRYFGEPTPAGLPLRSAAPAVSSRSFPPPPPYGLRPVHVASAVPSPVYTAKGTSAPSTSVGSQAAALSRERAASVLLRLPVEDAGVAAWQREIGSDAFDHGISLQLPRLVSSRVIGSSGSEGRELLGRDGGFGRA